MARFQIFLLGGFETRVDGQVTALRLPKKAMGLLAYLAIRPGQPCSRDKLVDLLWSEGAPDQARHSLRQALLTLRQSLAATAARTRLVSEGDTLALEANETEVDVAAFERLVADGRRPSLEQAAALYRGDFLEALHINEVPFEEWAVAERERLRELAVEGMARLLRQQDGAIEPAIQTALRLLRLDRTQEVVHRTLIRLYARQGRRAEAVRQYRACVDVLRRELGVAPEPATVRLYRELRQPRSDARPAPTLRRQAPRRLTRPDS